GRATRRCWCAGRAAAGSGTGGRRRRWSRWSCSMPDFPGPGCTLRRTSSSCSSSPGRRRRSPRWPRASARGPTRRWMRSSAGYGGLPGRRMDGGRPASARVWSGPSSRRGGGPGPRGCVSDPRSVPSRGFPPPPPGRDAPPRGPSAARGHQPWSPPWQRPRTVVAAWLLERGLASVGDLEQRRRDIRRAQALLEAGALEEEATELRRRAARDRAWEQGLPHGPPGWEEQAAWAERTARKSPAEVYQALRVQYLRALEAGQTELALRLRSALEAFRLEPARRPLRSVAPPPSEEERRGEDVLAELLLEAPAERRPLLDIGRAAAQVVAWDHSPTEEETPEAADVRHIA